MNSIVNISSLHNLGIFIYPAEDDDSGLIYLSPEEEQMVFDNQFLITKQEVLDRLAMEMDRMKRSNKEKDAYSITLAKMFELLYEQIEISELFDAPDGFWHYVIEYDSMGVYLRLLNETGYVTSYAEYVSDVEPQGFTMFTIPSKLLTIDEYATVYGVEPVTVRQWIRRGKIRTAFKAGNEWRIPELSGIPNAQRGYQAATYSWNATLDKVPEGYEFINTYDHIRFWRSNKDYVLKFWSERDNVEDKEVSCTVVEKEKIELFLISNPYVKYESDSCGIIDCKR